MRVQELIRAVLDMIDQFDDHEEQPAPEPETGYRDDDIARFKQIAGLTDNGSMSPLSNSPNPQYADVDAVTVDAGGGINEPKHPHDIRVKDLPQNL